MHENIATRDTLLEKWKINPNCKSFVILFFKARCALIYLHIYDIRFYNFENIVIDLLEAYSKWLPLSYHEEVTSIWPPVQTKD